MDIERVWPLFGLSLRSPRLELRPVRDDDLPALVDAAVAGVHDPERSPFGVPWTDAPPAELAHSFAAYHWGLRAGSSPEKWALAFTILHNGEPVGVQQLDATEFARDRTVDSGSWLTRRMQGRGLGTEMRAAILLFAFDHLGARTARSSAMVWNTPSLAVSRRLGYVDDGLTRIEPRPGEPVDEQRLRLERDAFVRPEWTLDVRYPEGILRDLGAAPTTTDPA
ncbi:GNAT family protein [Frondihabitans peucedani]|uniref:GNAT family protein n=1 Tax=Frondihabitans peucedani TaxID=598626 RepID=A0ABP8E4K8_9MICO